MSASHNWEWVQNREEGQFLERKSCYDRSSGESRSRPVKEVVQDVAAALVAMANADGGTVVVGIEDDGTVTGIPARYEFHQVQKQLNDYIRPALKFRAQEISLQRQKGEGRAMYPAKNVSALTENASVSSRSKQFEGDAFHGHRR